MRKVIVLLSILVLTGACTAIRKTFDGSDFRANRPWFDSRLDPADPSRFSNLQLDVATYCADKPLGPPSPKNLEFQTKMGTQRTRILSPNCDDKNPDGTKAADGGLAYERAKHSALTRDAFQDVLLRLSDEDCERHRAAIVGTNAGSNLLLSTLASLFAGGATGFAAASTKTALAGISTFFIASRSHLNEQIYHQIFVGTILKAIEDDRRAELLEIANRRRYPVPSRTVDPRDNGRVISAPADTAAASPVAQPPKAEASPGAQPPKSAESAGASPAAQPPKNEQPAGAAPKVSTPAVPTGTEASVKAEPHMLELRQSYSIDEAIKDAGEYHARCSFYNGLVRVAVTVERASPCRAIADRREQILSEMAAMKASGAADHIFKEKFDAYNAELSSLNTKVAACTQSGSQ